MDIKNLSPQNFQGWPLPLKAGIFAAIFGATFYLGYWFDISDQKVELDKVAKVEIDYKDQVGFVIRKNKTLNNEVSRLPNVKSLLVDWEKQLVPYNELPQLLNEILKLGANNNLYFSTFAPGESEKIHVGADEEKKADSANSAAQQQAQSQPAKPKVLITYYKVPIKVVVAGSYHNIAQFMSETANLSKVVSIGDFTISRSTDSSLLGEQLAKQATQQKLLTAELEFDVYHLN